MTGLSIRAAVPGDAPICADILAEWIQSTGWHPPMFTRAEIEANYRDRVLIERDAYVAESSAVAGFMTIDDEACVTALYVATASRGKHVGKAMLDLAKRRYPQGLSLWPYAMNTGAIRFYRREKFVPTGIVETDEELGLDEVELVWRPELGRCR